MRTLPLVLAALLTQLPWCSGAIAEQGIVTGRDMAALCASSDPRDLRACDLAISATITLTWIEAASKPQGHDGVRYCLPPGPANDDLRRLYVASVYRHPDERLSAPFVATILYGLRDAFPCVTRQ